MQVRQAYAKLKFLPSCFEANHAESHQTISYALATDGHVKGFHPDVADLLAI